MMLVKLAWVARSGWIGLVIVLAVLCFAWRGLPLGLLTRRLTAVALTGALIVLGSPPGTALWGEPAGQTGLPDRLAEPDSWTWAADLRQSPPGPAALVFSGWATNGDFEEGRIVLLAADGDRYRVYDVFQDPLQLSKYDGPGRRNPVLSPDGRYLTTNDATYDLTTGRPVEGLMGSPPAAWSADGKRIVRAVYEHASRTVSAWQIWDLPSQRKLRDITTVRSPALSEGIALSPTGDKLAVEQGDRVVIYPADGGSPVSWPHHGWRMAETNAWNRDGSLLAMTHDGCSSCTTRPPATQQLQLVDPSTGSVVAGGVFPRLPSDTPLRLHGWRSATELVVQVDNNIEILTRGSPTPARLLTLPPGVSQVEIAADRLSEPIRAAGPATYGPPNNFFWLIVAVAAIPLMLVVGIWVLIRKLIRRFRRRSRLASVTPGR